MAAGSFYQINADGTRTLLTIRGELHGDGTVGAVTDTTTPEDPGGSGGDPGGSTPGGAASVFGISPSDRLSPFASSVWPVLGKPVLLRRYQGYSIPGTDTAAHRAERTTAYWWEGNVNDTDTQIRARINGIPAGYICLGHENDDDVNFTRAAIRLSDLCLERADGKVKGAMIGRGFTLRDQGWLAYRDRVFPTAVTMADGTIRNPRTAMTRTFASTGQQCSIVCVDLYDGKNASDGDTTTPATNGTKFTPADLLEDIVKLAINLNMRWGVGEWAAMLSKYLPGDTTSPGPGSESTGPALPLGFRLGNRSDAQLKANTIAMAAFLANPAAVYPGGRPPEVFCYWFSYNGDIYKGYKDPFAKANNYILRADQWPQATAQMKAFLATSDVLSHW